MNKSVKKRVENTGKASRCRNPRTGSPHFLSQRPICNNVQSCKHIKTPKDTELCCTYSLSIGKGLGTWEPLFVSVKKKLLFWLQRPPNLRERGKNTSVCEGWTSNNIRMVINAPKQFFYPKCTWHYIKIYIFSIVSFSLFLLPVQ